VTSNPAPEVNPPDIFDGVSHLPVYHFLGRKRCFLLDGAGDSPDESEDTVSSIVSPDHSRHFSTRESRQQTPSNSDLAVDLTTSAIDVASAFPSVESSHTTGDSQSQHHTEFALASVEHDSPINRPSQHSSFDLHSADSNTETAPDDTSADRDSPIFLAPEVGASQQLPEESSHTESTPTTSSQTQVSHSALLIAIAILNLPKKTPSLMQSTTHLLVRLLLPQFRDPQQQIDVVVDLPKLNLVPNTTPLTQVLLQTFRGPQ
jgi:hypothetical protein